MSPGSPLWLVLLLPLLPFAWRASQHALAEAGLLPHTCRLLGPLVFGVALLLATHLVGLITGSFAVGLTVSCAFLAAFGIWRGPIHAPKETGPTRGWVAGLVALFVVAMCAGPILYRDFDEGGWSGHLTMSSRIANGHYPPRTPNFPRHELAYHYGVDLLTAIVSSITRVRVDRVLAALTLFALGYTFLLAWRLGEKLGGRVAALLTGLLAVGAGGWPFGWASPGGAEWLTRASGKYFPGAPIAPPLIACVVQHPWNLGLPLFFALILICLETDFFRRGERASLGLLGAGIMALALCEVALFPVAVVAVGLSARHFRAGAVILVAAAISTRLHGIFSGWETFRGRLSVASLGMAGTLGGSLYWNIAALGILLPLGIFGMRRLDPPLRRFLSFWIAGCLILANLIAYSGSGDVIKFLDAALPALAIAAGVELAAWWVRGRGSRVAALAGLGLGCFWSASVIAIAWKIPARLSEKRELAVLAPWPASRASDDEAIRYLRARMKPDSLLFRRADAARAYAQWGGLSLVWAEPGVALSHGIPTPEVRARLSLLEHGLPDSFARLRELGVDWLVLDRLDPERDRRLVEKWYHRGWLIREASLGSVDIYRSAKKWTGPVPHVTP